MIRQSHLLLFAIVFAFGVPKAEAFFGFFKRERVEWVSAPADDRGAVRAAKLYLPKAMVPSEKLPLVILLHGYSSNADRNNAYFGLGGHVNSLGFLLLTPEGTSNSLGHAFWNATDFCCDNEKQRPDDVGYLLRLVQEVRAKFAVDEKRIYLVGHSNGGFMANRLLCEAPGLFAAVVSLAGGGFAHPADCRSIKPVSYLQIHGIDDPTIKFDEVNNYMGGHQVVEWRAEANHCSGFAPAGKLDLVRPMAGADTGMHIWNGCAGGVETGLWLIQPYSGKPGSAHKPAFTGEFSNQVLNWLLKQRRSI